MIDCNPVLIPVWRIPIEFPVHSVAVLIVEDEPLIRIEAATAIEEAGFEVYQAGNAGQAVRLLAECCNIGVLFTDVEMPGSMNGLELACYAEAHFSPIRIIVTSGRRKIEDAMLPAESCFVSKPYRLEQVIDKLRQMAA